MIKLYGDADTIFIVDDREDDQYRLIIDKQSYFNNIEELLKFYISYEYEWCVNDDEIFQEDILLLTLNKLSDLNNLKLTNPELFL